MNFKIGDKVVDKTGTKGAIAKILDGERWPYDIMRDDGILVSGDDDTWFRDAFPVVEIKNPCKYTVVEIKNPDKYTCEIEIKIKTEKLEEIYRCIHNLINNQSTAVRREARKILSDIESELSKTKEQLETVLCQKG